MPPLAIDRSKTAQPFFQPVRVGRMAEGGVPGDPAPPDQFQDALVHGEHSQRPGGGDDAVQLKGLGLPDHVPYRRGHSHDLEGGNQRTALGGEELLGDHTLQRQGKLCADLPLLLRRKGVHDAVHRVGSSDGVEGGDDQMPRLGGGHGGLDGLGIPHLPQENDVGSLPQGGAESGLIGTGIGVELPLCDHALFVLMPQDPQSEPLIKELSYRDVLVQHIT